MSTANFTDLSETAQMLLGAFALADVHTLSAAEIETMSAGAIDQAAATLALTELVTAGVAEDQQFESVTVYRLSLSGLEMSLQLQAALQQRSSPD